MNRVDVGKYLLLHHRQPLACRFCLDAPHAQYAIHYHWVFAQHTGSPVPCLRTMVNHKVKDILSLKPDLCFPTGQPGITGRNSTCSLAAFQTSFKQVLIPLGNKGLVQSMKYTMKTYKVLDICDICNSYRVHLTNMLQSSSLKFKVV